MGNRITDGDFRDGTLGEWKAISGKPKVIVFPGTQEYVLFSGVNPPQPADDHPPVYMEVARTVTVDFWSDYTLSFIATNYSTEEDDFQYTINCYDWYGRECSGYTSEWFTPPTNSVWKRYEYTFRTPSDAVTCKVTLRSRYRKGNADNIDVSFDKIELNGNVPRTPALQWGTYNRDGKFSGSIVGYLEDNDKVLHHTRSSPYMEDQYFILLGYGLPDNVLIGSVTDIVPVVGEDGKPTGETYEVTTPTVNGELYVPYMYVPTPIVDIEWTTQALPWRGRNLDRIHCRIPAGNPTATGNLWGTGVYTDDSYIAKAAVHAGIITTAGGEFTVEIRPAQDSYTGSEANGMTSKDYGAYGGSFRFVEGGE